MSQKLLFIGTRSGQKHKSRGNSSNNLKQNSFRDSFTRVIRGRNKYGLNFCFSHFYFSHPREHVEVATVQLVLFNSTVILAPLEAFNLKN